MYILNSFADLISAFVFAPFFPFFIAAVIGVVLILIIVYISLKISNKKIEKIKEQN